MDWRHLAPDVLTVPQSIPIAVLFPDALLSFNEPVSVPPLSESIPFIFLGRATTNLYLSITDNSYLYQIPTVLKADLTHKWLKLLLRIIRLKEVLLAPVMLLKL